MQISNHNMIIKMFSSEQNKTLPNCTEFLPSSLCRFRLRNKKSSSVGRSFPLAPGVMGKTFTMEGSIHTDVSAGVGKGSGENTASLTEGVPGLTHPQLISRGAELMEEMKRAVPNGSNGANGSNGLSNRSSSGSTEQ